LDSECSCDAVGEQLADSAIEPTDVSTSDGLSASKAIPKHQRRNIESCCALLDTKIRHNCSSKRILVLLGRIPRRSRHAPFSIEWIGPRVLTEGDFTALSKTWMKKDWADAGSGSSSGRGSERKCTHTVKYCGRDKLLQQDGNKPRGPLNSGTPEMQWRNRSECGSEVSKLLPYLVEVGRRCCRFSE